MTRFVDGPAKGKTLMLKRAPVFLRVVQNSKTGAIDALDQEHDVAGPDENLFAYQLTAMPARAFIDGPKISGCYPIASYQLVERPPTTNEMRSNAGWILWVEQMKRTGNIPEFAKKKE